MRMIMTLLLMTELLMMGMMTMVMVILKMALLLSNDWSMLYMVWMMYWSN